MSKFDLSKIDNTKIETFTLNGYQTEANVVSVHDGDTIKAVFPFNDKLYRWNCRIDGVDTPELKTKNLKEKEAGIVARDALREKILDKVVKLTCKEFDKYGRLLVDVEYDNCLINKWLIDSNYAKPYFGGKKVSWEF